jgi:hypothetical protein
MEVSYWTGVAVEAAAEGLVGMAMYTLFEKGVLTLQSGWFWLGTAIYIPLVVVGAWFTSRRRSLHLRRSE